MKKLKEKQEELGKPQNKSHAGSEARELACTILNMSTTDLELFMKDDHHPEVGISNCSNINSAGSLFSWKT